MPIQNRNLEAGTRLQATYKQQSYICTVETVGGGEGLAYVLEDGKHFTSLSAAGSSVMGGKSVNGWRFWSLEGEAASTTEADANAGSSAKKSRKTIYRTPNQQQVPGGSTRWFCVSCMKGFIEEGSETPGACPEGHALEDLKTTEVAK